jgi:hypothetical protein
MRAFTKTTHQSDELSQKVHNEMPEERSQKRNTSRIGARHSSRGVTSIAHYRID